MSVISRFFVARTTWRFATAAFRAWRPFLLIRPRNVLFRRSRRRTLSRMNHGLMTASGRDSPTLGAPGGTDGFDAGAERGAGRPGLTGVAGSPPDNGAPRRNELMDKLRLALSSSALSDLDKKFVLTYDNTRFTDGVGAQLQRIYGIYSISRLLGV